MGAGEHKPERHLRLVPRAVIPRGAGRLARLTGQPAAALISRFARYARNNPGRAVALSIALVWLVSRALARRGP